MSNFKETRACIAYAYRNSFVTPQNVIIAAKCNKVFNAKCNNFLTQNVITFLTHNVITQNVITGVVLLNHYQNPVTFTYTLIE